MRMKDRFKKITGIVLCMAMMIGMVPMSSVSAQESIEQKNYLTDANGVPQEIIGRVAADNHELIDVNLKDGKTHKVTIYLLDEDASGRWSMVDVIDPDTQELLDSQNIYDFSEGVYLSYNISGHVQIRLTNVWTKRYQESKDTAIYGIFIDGKDAVENGTAVVTTEEPAEDAAANAFVSMNVLGRYVAAGETYAEPFDKQAESIELRFNGNLDPSSENLDKITVKKDGKTVDGVMRSSFNAVTFKPSEPMKDGKYTVTIPADVENSAGQKIGKEVTAEFEVKCQIYVTYFCNGMNYQTRRVDMSFNDKLAETPPAFLYYNGPDGDIKLNTTQSGGNGGRFYTISDTILPSGTYTFILPAGVKSVSGAVSTEAYVKTFDFESTQLSAEISAPSACGSGEELLLTVKESIGYGEVRYAFSEEALKEADYVPAAKNILVPTEGIAGGIQTLYVQFRVAAGEQKGTESPILHKTVKMGVLEEGAVVEFDMESAGAYTKDGWASYANPHDGIFDQDRDDWNQDASVFVADHPGFGFKDKYDSDGDAHVVTEDGIPYQLSKNIYVDGKPNIANGNGKTVPAPTDCAYETIWVLGAAKRDAEEGVFTLNYADGTSETQKVTFIYWGDDRNSDEIVFGPMAVRLAWASDTTYSWGYLRQYELKLDPNKELESITLPETTALVRVLALTGKEVDEVTESDSDVTAYSAGTAIAEENMDMTYDEFMELYGEDPILSAAADISDVTEVTNVEQILAGERNYDEEILTELEETVGEYGQGLYPYVRQPERLMSYKLRMQYNVENYEMDFEDVLETIRRVDNMTRGLEKKCYLVGWQTNGHDTGFPYLSEVNPRHKRPMDETSLESLKWLMEEAKKYHTTITLHVNFSDAYSDDDPLSAQMLKDQLAIRYADGSIHESGTWAKHKGFMVSAYANYFTGNWQENQIAPLLEMLPELKGQSVHPDAWYTFADPYYGLTDEDAAKAQQRSAKYLRDTYNMDLTTEFDVAFTSSHILEDHILYFPMIWQGGWTERDPMKVPSYLLSTVYEVTYAGTLTATGRYFGYGTPVEPLAANSSVTIPGLGQSFAEGEMTRQYLNTLMRGSLTDDEATGGKAVLYSGDGQTVTSEWNGDNSDSVKRTIVEGEDVVLEEHTDSGNNVFMPMVWRANLEIQAWSQNGYTDKTWKLPTEWEGVASVDIYDLTVEGLRFIETVEVSEDRNIVMSMMADQSAVVVPKGQNPNSTEGFAQNGTVQFLGKDTKTGGEWTTVYGSEGYDIFTETQKDTLPEFAEISYINGTLETAETGYIVEDTDNSQESVKPDEKPPVEEGNNDSSKEEQKEYGVVTGDAANIAEFVFIMSASLGGLVFSVNKKGRGKKQQIYS